MKNKRILLVKLPHVSFFEQLYIHIPARLYDVSKVLYCTVPNSHNRPSLLGFKKAFFKEVFRVVKPGAKVAFEDYVLGHWAISS